MNKTIGLALCGYGGLIALLAVGLNTMGIQAAQPSFLAGTVGGAACVLWGILALSGRGQRALSMITLILIALVFLAQTVNGWFGEHDFAGRPAGPALITLMLLATTALLMMVGHAGVPEVGAHPAPSTEPTRPSGRGQPAQQTR